MSKFLVTSGCSFSTVFNHDYDLVQGGTWPHVLRLLTPNYQWRPIALGAEGQGNGLISRKLIKTITDLIHNQKVAATDIFVGVMWSGPDRIETHDGAQWQIAFPQSRQYQTYHKFIGNSIANTVITLEHILRVQWFLKQAGIKYFMCTYTGEVFEKFCVSHTDAKYLYQQIDFSKFLPITGMYEWCRDIGKVTFPISGDIHPGFKQHKEFTEKVILPFCIENKLIDI